MAFGGGSGWAAASTEAHYRLSSCPTPSKYSVNEENLNETDESISGQVSSAFGSGTTQSHHNNNDAGSSVGMETVSLAGRSIGKFIRAAANVESKGHCLLQDYWGGTLSRRAGSIERRPLLVPHALRGSLGICERVGTDCHGASATTKKMSGCSFRRVCSVVAITALMLRACVVSVASYRWTNVAIERATNQTDENVAIESLYSVISNIPVGKEDIPIFWYASQSGGKVVMEVLSKCVGLTGTGDYGAEDKSNGEGLPKIEDRTLQVITNNAGIKYVNVDTSTPDGIERARSLDLPGSSLADVIFVSDIRGASRMFTQYLEAPKRRARIFALLRHPVKRAVTMYSLHVWADGSLVDDDLSLLDYSSHPQAGDNPLTRALTGEDQYEMLTVKHVQTAKEFLRLHVLVGITEFMDASIVRFEQYFAWWDKDNIQRLKCQGDTIMTGDTRGSHLRAIPSSPEFQALAIRNWADVEVYHYAKKLFAEQTSLIL